MPTLTIPQEINELSIPEKIILVENIWNSIPPQTDEIPLSSDQKIELDQRREAHNKNPNSGASWPTVKNRIINKIKK